MWAIDTFPLCGELHHMFSIEKVFFGNLMSHCYQHDRPKRKLKSSWCYFLRIFFESLIDLDEFT